VGSEEIAGRIGRVLREKFGWKVDLKKGKLEIFVYITDDCWIAGIPVLRQPIVAGGQIVHSGTDSAFWYFHIQLRLRCIPTNPLPPVALYPPRYSYNPTVRSPAFEYLSLYCST
jgi:hypothetical protein